MKQKATVYGYARVSTQKQKLDRQITNIREFYADAEIITEKYTGTKMSRPEWNKLYKKLKPGDTVIFDEVSRMSRNADEGFTVYQELYNRGVKLIFLKERHIDTDIYRQSAEASIPITGNEIADIYIDATERVLMILAKKQIKIAFEQAQAEVDHLHKRISEGMRASNAPEKISEYRTGRKTTTKKSTAAKEIIKKYNKDFNDEHGLNDIATMKLITGELGTIARNSYYKYKRELADEIINGAEIDEV